MAASIADISALFNHANIQEYWTLEDALADKNANNLIEIGNNEFIHLRNWLEQTNSYSIYLKPIRLFLVINVIFIEITL